ncbi:protein of unknown function [Microbacterium sp. Nx66]|nr:protein of unknown function [Microbacterium sp. Nx66]
MVRDGHLRGAGAVPWRRRDRRASGPVRRRDPPAGRRGRAGEVPGRGAAAGALTLGARPALAGVGGRAYCEGRRVTEPDRRSA